MTRFGARELGTLPYWLIVALLFVVGILSLPSIGWLLIALALGLALTGGMRSHGAIAAPLSAGLLGLIAAYLLFAPGLCVGGEGEETRCTSFAAIPLGGENWVPFMLLGPLIAIGFALYVRRSKHRLGERTNG